MPSIKPHLPTNQEGDVVSLRLFRGSFHTRGVLPCYTVATAGRAENLEFQGFIFFPAVVAGVVCFSTRRRADGSLL